jgi:hypothetical protein
VGTGKSLSSEQQTCFQYGKPRIIIAALTLSILHGFLPSLHENAGMVFQIGHDFQGRIIIITIIIIIEL